MIDRLKSFLIEIECPSGAKLVGDLSRMVHAMALEFYFTTPHRWTPPGIEIPEDIYAHVCEDEGRALNYIFGMPWATLLKVLDPHVAAPGPKDQELWEAMQARAMSATPGSNPFLARVRPKVTPADAPQPQELFQDIKGVAQTALDRLREGNTEGAVNLLASLVVACENVGVPPMPPPSYDVLLMGLKELFATTDAAIHMTTKGENPRTVLLTASKQLKAVIDAVRATGDEPNPALFLIRCPSPEHLDAHPSCQLNPVTGDYSCFACGAKGKFREGEFYATEDGKPRGNATAGDGWGHAHEADTVEALLREGDAMFKGTDRHEQVFKGMDERVETQFLFNLIKSLQRDRATAAARADSQSKRIDTLETLVRDLGRGHQQMVQSLQKVHRRLKTDFLLEAYGGQPETNQLRRKAHEVQKLIQFAKEIEANPILRQLLSV